MLGGLVYAASMPPNPTRRELLGLAPIMLGLAVAAASPAYLDVEQGTRFTLVLAQDLPAAERKPKLDLAVEHMQALIDASCFGPPSSVRRIGEHIVLGIAGDDERENLEVAEWMIRRVRPLELRIDEVKYGIVDVSISRPSFLYL